MDFSALLIEGLQLAIWLVLPALGACAAVALIMSALQAALQAHDPGVSFAPKLIATLTVLWLTRDFFSERLLGFATRVLHAMATLG